MIFVINFKIKTYLNAFNIYKVVAAEAVHNEDDNFRGDIWAFRFCSLKIHRKAEEY